jgi:UDP-N-acetylglucosamine 2-epimerase (non-hydrolysing)/GDP/UDP-N,N'-diacetylbacillosamine 2-epimerase (hydrolysing)
MKAIENNPKLELSVIPTGMHLSSEHGNTINEIKKDGFKVDAVVDMLLCNDSGAAMAKSLGIGLIGITQALEHIRPDIVLVLGDRGEPFAGAIAASHMNIPVAHVHGGDSTTGGCIDESIRHSITKFAHIHFPATEGSAERIKKLGEEPWRIHTIGAPALDTILNTRLISRERLIKKFSFNADEPLLIAVQHPVTTQPENAANEMRITLEALTDLKIQTILIYPNSDAGGHSMIEVIKEYKHLQFLRIYKNLPHLEYLSLMKVAGALVGNSSSGIIEAPSFHLPVINIGIRQEGRERGRNVIDVAHDKTEITKAINTALYDEAFKKKINECVNPYGDGKASLRIVEILAGLEINQKLLQKKITY